MSSLVGRFIAKYGRLPTEFDSDYLEMLRMSKYKILDIPKFKPGKCANCGASKDDGRKYIDFGLELEWFGIFYLCGTCLEDVALNFGLFKKYEEEIARLKETSFDLKILDERGYDLQETILKTFEEVKEYYDSLHSLGDDKPVDSSAVVVDESPTIEPRIDAPKQRAAKSTSSAGSKNLPSLAELLDRES